MKTKKKRKKGLHKNGTLFFPEFKWRPALRCTPSGSDADVDHIQTIGRGIQSNYWGYIFLPPPRVSAPLNLRHWFGLIRFLPPQFSHQEKATRVEGTQTRVRLIVYWPSTDRQIAKKVKVVKTTNLQIPKNCLISCKRNFVSRNVLGSFLQKLPKTGPPK